MIADAFGNPLGTSYDPNCDPYTAGLHRHPGRRHPAAGPCDRHPADQEPGPGQIRHHRECAYRRRAGSRPPPSKAPRSSTPGSRPTSPPSSSSSASRGPTSSWASPRNSIRYRLAEPRDHQRRRHRHPHVPPAGLRILQRPRLPVLLDGPEPATLRRDPVRRPLRS